MNQMDAARKMKHLAQVNVARFRWPLTDERMKHFVERIDAINQLAESSPGFVWRFSEEYVPGIFPAPFNLDQLFFNMSVWKNVESLREFVIEPRHAELIRRRSEWVEPIGGPPLAMWWVTAGHEPTTSEAIDALVHLRENGESESVFTFASKQK